MFFLHGLTGERRILIASSRNGISTTLRGKSRKKARAGGGGGGGGRGGELGIDLSWCR